MSNEPVHSRIDLACEQIDVAIDLFMNAKSNVSALTLAGAADEILGIEIKNQGKKNTLSVKYAVIEKLLEKSDRKTPSWQEFKDDENFARNAAKHIADKSQKGRKYDPLLYGDLRHAAMYMILRASNNVRILGLPRSEKVEMFEGWYLTNIAYPSEPRA